MGSVFRRSYTDRTGKRRKTETYYVKYRKDGIWVTEPTSVTQKCVAERLLVEKERQVQLVPAGERSVEPPSCSDPGGPASGPGLEELLGRFLVWFRRRTRPYTFERREECLRGTLAGLATKDVTTLRLPEVDAYAERRLAAGIAETTVNCEMRYLRHVLAWAVDQELIAANPLTKWQPVKERPRRQRRAMAPEEVQRLLAVSPMHRRVAWAVFLASGIRRSELIYLLLTDLDLQHAVLVIRAEVSKTAKLRRVFLPEGVVELLREYLAEEARARRPRQERYLSEVRRRIAAYEAAGRSDSPKAETWRHLQQHILACRGHEFLFVNGRGLPLPRNNNLLRSFRSDLRRAKIDLAGLDQHALRKTTNTAFLRAGVNPAIIRARLGHSSASMTDLYTDSGALDTGGHTEALADLLGLPAREGAAAANTSNGSAAPASRRHRHGRTRCDRRRRCWKRWCEAIATS